MYHRVSSRRLVVFRRPSDFDRYLSLAVEDWGAVSRSNDGGSAAERCGVETSEGTPCKNPKGSCPHHDAEGAESPSGDSHVIPTDEEWWREHSRFIGILTDTEEAWDGKSFATTVAVTAIRDVSDSADEKRQLYRAVFGPCPADGCQQGQNGFEKDACPDHYSGQDEDDDDTSDESMTVVIDGKEVTGSKETIQELLNQ